MVEKVESSFVLPLKSLIVKIWFRRNFLDIRFERLMPSIGSYMWLKKTFQCLNAWPEKFRKSVAFPLIYLSKKNVAFTEFITLLLSRKNAWGNE